MPLCEIIDGQNKHSLIPNGINFFGPKGTGKTYFAEQLAEHYVKKGGYFKEISLSGDATKDISYLQSIFSTAKSNFIKSGRKKYTMILIDELEKKLDRNNVSQLPVTEKLLALTKNCKDKGVIFLSTANYLNKARPAFLKNGRTDLRIPIGQIANYDLADVINYYLKKDNLPHSEEIDFQKVVDAVKTKKLQYKPKDIESRLVKEADNFADFGGELTTQDISDALVLSKPEFDEAEHIQFNADKIYANKAKLGGIYEY